MSAPETTLAAPPAVPAGDKWRRINMAAGLGVAASLAVLLTADGAALLPARVVLLAGLVMLAAGLLRGRERKFFSGPSAYVATASLFLLAVLAIFATEISPQNPYDLRQLDIMDGRQPPGSTNFDGSMTYHLGTDEQGRDILSGILYGLRVSLSVSIFATLAAMAIGVVVGIYAAWAGGRTDAILMRIVDFQLSFPSILVALMLMAAFGRGLDKIVIALIIVQWAYYARTVRGNALSEARKEYIDAARGLGLPAWRIVFGHLLPNCIPPLIVISTVQVANTIVLESSLSFLGVGVPITQPSLGLLIANGYGYMLSGQYWMSMYPGVALLAIVASINMVGDRLRDTLNPRLSR
ncbi:ABC transporter permease [Roseibacterium sp. SDUM158016]|jgi:peptide/nickel transport system permease protein|uniref:ABC transporter permease n=1 Tax=Roseicyclus sediminis TaxID=2980997 RepID=UPI0021D03702|nr:ABC transporter permease [Roseibacterium sp. SDUM158016]MCU4653011.1 ABC transporter permease [Roseibacterium sp. SDUM158016]